MIPDLSTLWVIAIVLVLSILLDRLLLRPATRVMKAREGAMRSARDLAESSRIKARAASDEFEAKLRGARSDVYRQMDDTRRTALATRAELVAETRRDIERSTSDAAARLRDQATIARAQLDSDADALANSIVERVLGRKAS